MACIRVENLQKTFTRTLPGKGILGSFRSISTEVKAVLGVSFTIEPGERVAFIGPNGAGKSTTIKMLCGILVPSKGVASVRGYTPWNEREKLSYHIGIVFGQRSQLWPQLSIKDSFHLLGAVYDREKHAHERRVAELTSLLEVEKLLNAPAGKLSLGERMRCELVASLLHTPSILFLDEPTIGLDVHARLVIRKYIKRISETEGVTILLTSHDTGDIAEVCDRVIVINHGSLILDKPVDELQKGYIQQKRIKAVIPPGKVDLSLRGVTFSQPEDTLLDIEIDTSQSSIDTVVRELLSRVEIHDLTIEDPPLEETIMSIYKEKRRSEV